MTQFNGKMMEFDAELAEFDDTLEYGFDDDEMYEFDDDDEAYEFDDDEEDYSEDFDDDELAELRLGKRIKNIANRLRGRKGKGRGPFKFFRPRPNRPNLPSTRPSNLSGTLVSNSGKSVAFKLPSNVATKQDVAALRKSIGVNARNISSASKGVNVNIANIKKAAQEIRNVDQKHTTASNKQNEVLKVLNTRVNTLKRELDTTRQQASTNLMLSTLMGQPEIKSIDFNGSPVTGSNAVDGVTYEDNNMPLMLAAMSGGFGGSGDNNGQMLMMMALMGGF